jgi:hypothetical protein
LSPETCRAELKILINEKVVASCWLFTLLKIKLILSHTIALIKQADVLVCVYL